MALDLKLRLYPQTPKKISARDSQEILALMVMLLKY